MIDFFLSLDQHARMEVFGIVITVLKINLSQFFSCDQFKASSVLPQLALNLEMGHSEGVIIMVKIHHLCFKLFHLIVCTIERGFISSTKGSKCILYHS